MLEETEMSSEETQEESSPAKEPTAPLHVVTALRSRAQAAEVEAANLRGQLSTLQVQAEPTKSPMEIEIERQAAEGIDEEDMTISPAIYRKDQAFQKRLAEESAVLTADNTLREAQLASTATAKIVHEDWQDVMTKAVPHMTKGEMLDIENAGADFGEVAYAKAQEVLLRVNPKAAPETSEPEPEEKVVETKGKTPTQDEILADLAVDPMVEAALKL